MLLLVNLPVDSSSFYAPYYNAASEGEEYVSEYSNKAPKGWAKKELDRLRGRGNRPRNTVGLDQFLGEVKGQGTNK